MSNTPQVTDETPEVGPCIRLVVCEACHSVEEIPDWDGPKEYDVFLDDMGERHRLPDGTRNYHNGLNLYRVEVKHWANKNTQREIIKQIWGGSKGLAELDTEYYASKATYYEDAMGCFNLHNRPKGSCIDWKDDRKRIGNPTSWGWQQGPKVYLCDFCPVKSHVATEQRWKKGMYK